MSAFEDAFGLSDDLDLFDSYPKPPESVPLRLLGLVEMPATRYELSSAFTRQVKANHPDVNPIGRLTMDELVWARKVLLKKMPPSPSVTGITVAAGHMVSRYEPEPCKGGCGKLGGGGWRQGRRWRGFCEPCSYVAENAELRERRRLARADRMCAVCDAVFTPARSDGRYCKSACRQRAFRARKAAS